jgi:DNA-binding transcriptional LysR family regulator
MNITFRQLRLFQALAETGSVSAAARAMHITQPSASMQLREVTEAVGVPLYEVIGRKVFLTTTGQELARAARAMAQEWDNFAQQVDATKGLTRGRLRVAVVSTAKYFVPRLVGSFCNRHPGIDVALEVLNRDGVVQRLRENMDDLYIMSTPPDDLELTDDVLTANPLVIIAAESASLASQSRVSLEALAGWRFILREKGSGTRMAVDQHFRARGFRPQVRMELGSNEAIKEAVAGGLGLGVISSHALKEDLHRQGLAVLAVEGFPLPSNWHLVHLRAKKLSPIATAFKNHLLEHTRAQRSA